MNGSSSLPGKMSESRFCLNSFAVPSQGIVQFSEDFSALPFLGVFAALREIFPFVVLSVRKRIRLSRKTGLFVG